MQYNNFKILLGVFILIVLIIVLIVVAVNSSNDGGDNHDDSSDDDFSNSIGPVSSFESECHQSAHQSKTESVEFSEKNKKPFKNYKK